MIANSEMHFIKQAVDLEYFEFSESQLFVSY